MSSAPSVINHPSKDTAGQAEGEGSFPLTAGLYVHVPFCRSKCPYCDFYSVTSPGLCSDWLAALQQEARLYTDRFSQFSQFPQFPQFDTIYIGGGTPTVLNKGELAALGECLFEHFHFSQNLEFTVEANPNDITPGKLRTLKDLGVNRISLGVQSLDNRDLKFLGRRHTAGEAIRALAMIRSAGFHNVGIDLMYGLPEQTPTAWQGILEKALTFDPEHISCYQLTVATRTPLGKLREAGRFPPLEEEEEQELFLTASRFLEANSYVHYEISNFARKRSPGPEGEASPLLNHAHVCRHNHQYWQRTPYLGLGPSAHSYQGNRRWWNFRSLSKYCRSLADDDSPVEGQECLTEQQASLEELSLTLRTREGIGLKQLARYPKSDTALPELIEKGYLRVIRDRVIPTRQGYLVADHLPLLFL